MTNNLLTQGNNCINITTMKLTDKEFKRLRAMCDRMEDVFEWTPGTLQGKSQAKDVVQIRDQLVLDAWEQGTTITNLARFFNKTRQSIYAQIAKAKRNREWSKKYNNSLNWLADVDK